MAFVVSWYNLPFNAIKSKYKAIQEPQQENDTQRNGGYIMRLFRITTDNKITPGATGNPSGLVWILSKIYKAFKGFLRGFSWLVAIYTAFVFQGLILAYRGLKRVYIKPPTIQDNGQPQTIQDTHKNEKVSKICYFYKKYWLNKFNPRILGVCVSFLDFDIFIKF